MSLKATTSLAIAAALSSALAAVAVSQAQAGREREVLRRFAEGPERLRGRRRHHLRRDLQGRLPGQRLEARRSGHLRHHADPVRPGLADAPSSARRDACVPRKPAARRLPRRRDREEAMTTRSSASTFASGIARAGRRRGAQARARRGHSSRALAGSISSRSTPRTTWAPAARRIICCSASAPTIRCRSTASAFRSAAPRRSTAASRAAQAPRRDVPAGAVLRTSRLVQPRRRLSERSAAAALQRHLAGACLRPCRTRCRTRSACGCCWRTLRPMSPSAQAR